MKPRTNLTLLFPPEHGVHSKVKFLDIHPMFAYPSHLVNNQNRPWRKAFSFLSAHSPESNQEKDRGRGARSRSCYDVGYGGKQVRRWFCNL